MASLNQWTEQPMMRIPLTPLRDQAEAFAYGLPMENTVENYQFLKGALNQKSNIPRLRRVVLQRQSYEGNKTEKHSGIFARPYKTCIDVLILRIEY